MTDGNFLTGSSGLIAVDKVGNHVLFLNPVTYETELTLEGFAPRVHELLISPDHRFAFVPVYGDGIHGDNPHPGHLIALFDLQKRRHAGDFSTYPYLAPHGLRWGARGQLYCVCENSGVALEMDPESGTIEHVIEVGSNKAHRIEVSCRTAVSPLTTRKPDPVRRPQTKSPCMASAWHAERCPLRLAG